MPPSDPGPKAEVRVVGGPRVVDVGVIAAAAVLLLAGVVYARASVPPRRTAHALGGKVRLVLPPGWAGSEHDGTYVAQPPTLEGFAPTLSVQRIETPKHGAGPMFVDLEVARMGQQRAATGSGYRVLSTDDRKGFGGHHASLTEYAIVRDPPLAGAGSAVLPEVLAGVDVLVMTKKGAAYEVSAFEPARAWQHPHDTLHRALDTVRIAR